MTQRCCLLTLFVLTILCPEISDAADPPTNMTKKNFECRWAEGKITIDGKADEPAWKNAELIQNFYQPWLQENARMAKTPTKARLLWDKEFLYFTAEMEDADLYADISEHDGETWYNDVFELFFKPDTEKHPYYEFQVNAAGTVMDLFLPRRGAGGFRRWINAHDFHIDAKVKLQGTLNNYKDKDKGWTVEGKIPWTDFKETSPRPAAGAEWKFALCRYDYSIYLDGPDLSTCAPLKSKRGPDFHLHEDYATLKFVGKKTEVTQRESRKESKVKRVALKDWSPVTTSRVVGTPDPPLPYKTVRRYPKLSPNFMICVVKDPTSNRLYFLDQERAYGTTRICRTKGDPSTGEFEVLHSYKDILAYSICFHPKFAENGYLYVGANGKWAEEDEEKKARIERFTIARDEEQKFDVESATTIIEWESEGHCGLAMAFGLDGMMFLTSGDGTSDSDTNLTGQGLDHLLAKVMRIDVDDPAEGKMYSIPEDNPFVGEKDVAPETWAYGFRNPWRMTVDKKTGHLWVGNNGQDLWEQVYLVEKKANYGWSVYEGSHPFYLERKLGPHPHTKPTMEHPHSESRSLTGGVVYYGSKHPKLQGAYIYGDHSTGKVWGVKHNGKKVTWSAELVDTPFNISCFAIDDDGELLIVDHRGKGEGGLYTLEVNDEKFDPKAFPRTLSESGLFDKVACHKMKNGLIPYSVNSPLWSDGAFKARFIALPPTMEKVTGKEKTEVPAQMDFNTSSSWNLPEKTVLVKSFGLEMVEGDPNSRKWIETRFLTKQQGEWVGYSYAWNTEQTEGTLVEGVGRDQTFEILKEDGTKFKQTWRYPSRTECMTCHSRASKFVLGVSTPQLNKIHDYHGVKANQLEVMESLGVLKVSYDGSMKTLYRKNAEEAGQEDAEITARLKEFDEQKPALATSVIAGQGGYPNPYDESADLEARVKSYLHVNCASCHTNAGGGNSQMDLKFLTALDKMKMVNEKPLHHKFGIEDPLLVAPGAPDRSVLLHRLAIRDRGQMPQLGTSIADKRAVDLMRKWIASLKE